MKVPSSVLEKIEEILARDAAEDERERKVKLEEKRRWKEVDQLRKRKKKELLVYAQKAVVWLKDFYDSKEGKKILKVSRRVTLFNASFWNGFSAPGSEMMILVTIEISEKGRVFYSERYKGFSREALPLGSVKTKMNPNALVRKLHPEYLELFIKSLESGKVWQHIEWSLRRS